MAQPWYLYLADSPGGGYGEICDPESGYTNGKCNYLKPDTNIAVPSGTPITALTSGIVTNVQDFGGGAGGLSVTVKMDQALNSLAQYGNYNFLGGASVSKGQRVSVGQQIGTAGSPYGIDFALALSSGPTWGGSGFQYNAQGNPLLDPRQLLNAVKSGTLNLTATGGGGGGTTGSSGGTSPGTLTSDIISGIYGSSQVRNTALMFVAIVIVVIGLVLVFK